MFKFDELAATLEHNHQQLHERFEENSYRLFHGRSRKEQVATSADEPPQLNIDIFYNIAVVYNYQEHLPKEKLGSFLKELLPQRIEAIVYQPRYAPPVKPELLAGSLPQQALALENKLYFVLDSLRMNTGFYTDIYPLRKLVFENSTDAEVLNLFAFTCSFAVVAIAAGAKSVINVDMNSNALSRGRASLQLNNLAYKKAGYWAHNIMHSLGKIEKKRPYDLIIIDPPMGQPRSFNAAKDYPKLIKRLLNTIEPGSRLIATDNNPHHDFTFLKDLFADYKSIIEQCSLHDLKGPGHYFTPAKSGVKYAHVVF